ncbi:MAG: hypothetical protein NC099_05810 [Corallococcus sp.]|nr:hypothetical protein [Corallococcus sp.]
MKNDLNDLVFSVLTIGFKFEIANDIYCEDNYILVKLENGETARISTKKSGEIYAYTERDVPVQNDYVLNHDYGDGYSDTEQINKLKLRDVKDLRCYVKDIIESNIVNASVKGDIVTGIVGEDDVEIAIRILSEYYA